jgi:hypothetical protein
MTIAKALEGATEHYSPSGQHVNGHHAPERPEADNAWRYPGSEQDKSISFSMPTQPKWPEPIAPEAFYGLAGDVVRAIEPHTEADPSSLLLNFLAMYGNAVGFEPHAVAEAARHGGNLNVCVVGETSKGRKVSSTGRIQDLFFRADPTWAGTHIQHGGLSSGEGLIWAVRDPIEKLVKDKKSKEYTKEVIDEGVEDKRLLIVESEFANTLKVMGREGNSLSPILRQAWDSGNLSTLTKNSPARATQAHISVIGHITKEELTRYLSETESANGFANRFLWCCSKRAQALPEGGGVPHFGGLVEHLHNSLDLGRKTRLMERDGVAKEAWAVVYPELSEGKGGMFGAIIGRSEAQVLRLSLVYALLDASSVIQLPHLKAALAVWEYCEASARYIFGDATGDVVADQILESLRQSPEGLDRTHISALLGRNLSLNRINHALGLLLRTKRARFEKVVPESGQGRPREVWRAVRYELFRYFRLFRSGARGLNELSG